MAPVYHVSGSAGACIAPQFVGRQSPCATVAGEHHPPDRIHMKSALLAAFLLAFATLVGSEATLAEAAPQGAQLAAGAPIVPTLNGLIQKELRWGMSHAEVTDVYNRNGGLYDREYVVPLTKLQPGVEMQELEADRDSRKATFERSITHFTGDPTGYDVTPLHDEYTYKNDEAVQKLVKDGKTRYFFYIRDKLWKVYDEIPLKEGGSLGETFQQAITKLNKVLTVPGRIRAASSALGLERTEVDWQDRTAHLRALDRSGEHLVAIVLEDKSTLANLASLRSNKPVDPFALDPSIVTITKGGVTDPNAGRSGAIDSGPGKGKR